MAKLILLLATFALFLLLANASIRTTVEINEDNPQGQESCQQQCQQQQQLSHCQMYMRQQSQKGGQWDNQQQQLHECCRQMQQMDSRCRCQCLEQALRRQQQQQYGGQEMQEMYETASQLPRMCNIQPMRGCDFSTPYNSA